MLHIRHIVLLSVGLWTVTANAQPIMVTEHDWTLSVGNGRYGVFQSNISPGYLQRRTTVYCRGPLFTVSMRAEVLLGLILVPLGTLGTMLLMTWRQSKR